MKLAEFEKDLENRWSLCEEYIPPLLTTDDHPFLSRVIMELKTRLDQFHGVLELESTTGQSFEGHTLETKLCLLEIAKMRRLLANMGQQGFLASRISFTTPSAEYLDTISIMYNDKTNFKLLPYQHEKLGTLFGKLDRGP